MPHNFNRALKFALTDISRNKGMVLASVFVLSVTTLLITGIFFMHGASNFLITSINQKIDITAYFKADTAEQDILDAKTQIMKDSPDIKSVEYVSQEKALANFMQKHQGDTTIEKALAEVGDNPFLPSLNIITNGSPAQYAKVAELLQGEHYAPLIAKVDFYEKKDTIEKVFSITSTANKFGIGLGILLVLVAVSVVFNTIRLVIESSKEEISTMNIVGAPSWLIRAPFLIQGALFGLISFGICFVMTMLAVYFLSPGLGMIMPGFNIFQYALSQILIIIALQLGFAAGLGVASSFLVVRKYLKH